MEQTILNTISEFAVFMINLLLWGIFWTIVFEIIGRIWLKREAREDREELVNTIAKLLHRVKQEKHGDITYLFDADSDEFLGQGKTEEEIKQHLKERFKGHAFIIDDTGSAWAGPDLKKVPVHDLKMRDDRTIA